MKCLSCDSEDFELKNAPFCPEIKGEKIEVLTYAFVCMICQTPLMDGVQMDDLRKKAADKYELLHSQGKQP